MRQALGVGREWRVIWQGHAPFDTASHLCAGLAGPPGAYQSEWVNLLYAPTATPGVEAARCARCRTAWLRRA